MDKKTFIASFAALFVCALLFGCAVLRSPQNTDNPAAAGAKNITKPLPVPTSYPANSTSAPKAPAAEQNLSPALPAKGIDAFEFCGKINNESQRGICLAVARKNISECDSLPASANASCREYVSEILALNSGNTSLCSSLECFSAVALEKLDPSLCRNPTDVFPTIAATTPATDCYYYIALAKSDPSVCGVIAETSTNWRAPQFTDDCYREYLQAKGDVSVCPRMIPEIDKIDCYTNSALLRNDSSFCDRINTTGEVFQPGTYSMSGDPDYLNSLKLTCYASVRHDMSICGGINKNSPFYRSWYGDCQDSVARASKNSSICDQIPPGDASIGNCYDEVAVQTRDLGSCDTAPDEQYCMDEVYRAIAGETANVSVCDNMKDSYLSELCKEASVEASWNTDISVCNSLDDTTLLRSQCYSKLALAKNDSSLCEALQGGSEKDNCYLGLISPMGWYGEGQLAQAKINRLLDSYSRQGTDDNTSGG